MDPFFKEIVPDPEYDNIILISLEFGEPDSGFGPKPHKLIKSNTVISNKPSSFFDIYIRIAN